jgi:hypothetical protein
VQYWLAASIHAIQRLRSVRLPHVASKPASSLNHQIHWRKVDEQLVKVQIERLLHNLRRH